MDASAGELPPPLPPPRPPAPELDGSEPDGDEHAPVAAQPGQLAPIGRAVMTIGWALAFVACLAVFKTSRDLGLATWWLGPRGNPQPWYVLFTPFAICGAMVGLALSSVRWVPWAGLVAAGGLAAVGARDLGYVPRLGFVELVIAGAGCAVSVAGFAHRYQPLGRSGHDPVGQDG